MLVVTLTSRQFPIKLVYINYAVCYIAPHQFWFCGRNSMNYIFISYLAFGLITSVALADPSETVSSASPAAKVNTAKGLTSKFDRLYSDVFSSDRDTIALLDPYGEGRNYSYFIGKKAIELTEEEQSKSPIVKFYLGKGYDYAGRTIEEIWSFPTHDLEDIHDFIQWIFPSFSRSEYNEHAPLLTDADIQEFRNSKRLQTNLIKSFEVMLAFYGFVRTTDSRGNSVITKSDSFEKRTLEWVEKENHNFLRITRILKCLRVLGLQKEALAFYKALDKEMNPAQKEIIGERTYNFWRRASWSR